MKYILSYLFFLTTFSLQAQLQGIVVDDHNIPLVGATITLTPSDTYSLTNQDGRFYIESIAEGNYEMLTSYVGHKTDTLQVVIVPGRITKVRVILTHHHNVLETVHISDEHAKQEVTLQAEHIHEDFFHKHGEGTFAKAIEKIPGVSAINVGVGIAKPVIRGLSSNRIIVNHQGIKQESQQWGNDHGLEIDQFGVERVEIIKGPGSLQYGSDGLGGVINIMPDKLIPKNSIKGRLIGLHKTNNYHWGGSAKVGININNWFLTTSYSRQDFADYSVPTNTFNYNGFDLPIFNERLKNTAGDEANFEITAGVKKDWGITRIHYSHYGLEAGIFSGAVGIPRSYPLADDGNIRDIDVPKQNVNHYRLTFNQTVFLGENHFVLDVGLQRNLRKEFSEPEFHSIPLSQLKDPNDKLALELNLETFSIASHFEQAVKNNWKFIYGLNAQWQTNQRGGFEYLLPDFKTFRGGIYTISEKEMTEDWVINGGLRLDLGKNNTEAYRQYIWDSNESIIDSLFSEMTDQTFINWSASVGTNLMFFDDKFNMKFNLGKSFRVPYPAETVSNGIHHGTFRHEVGTPDLTSENGYQLDIGAYLTRPDFSSSLALYFNYFENYIYLGPTFPAQFSTLPEAGQIFQYRQDDAIYTGFEFQWEYDINATWNIEQAVDFVQSYNPKTKLALPFTPQPAIRTSGELTLPDKTWVKESFIGLEHEYHFAANGTLRLDRSERPTPAYHLISVRFQTALHFANHLPLELKCEVQNLFNTKYLAHLSRYRLINVPEQGRNIVLSMKIPFEGKIKQIEK